MMTDMTAAIGMMKEMKLGNMAAKLGEMTSDPNFGLRKSADVINELVSFEYDTRQSRRTNRLLRKAQLKYPAACLDDSIDDPRRKLDGKTIRLLAECGWIDDRKNLIITGKSGTGKTYIMCALAVSAIQKGKTVLYVKASMMINELSEYQLTGNYNGYLKKYTDPDLLVIDDFGLMSLDISKALHLFEVLDAREGSGSIAIIAQIPVASWYEIFRNSVYADACLSRMANASYRLEFDGSDRRQEKKNKG